MSLYIFNTLFQPFCPRLFCKKNLRGVGCGVARDASFGGNAVGAVSAIGAV